MAGPIRLLSQRARAAALLAGLVLVAGAALSMWLLRGVWDGKAFDDPDGPFFVMAVPSLALGLGCLLGVRRFVLWARGWCSIVAVGIPIGIVLGLAGCERAKRSWEHVRPATAISFAAWHGVALLFLFLATRAEAGEAPAEGPPPPA
jgi:hypothetical protein